MALQCSSIVAHIPIPSLVVSPVFCHLAVPNLRIRGKVSITNNDDKTSEFEMRGLQDECDMEFLHSTFLRTIWLFQLLVSGPVAGALGTSAFVRLLEVHGAIYDAVTSLVTALIAAGIVFIVIVQRKTFENGISIGLTLKFECIKSTFATMLWVWLMVDSGIQEETYFNRRVPRLVAASCSSVLLILIFYPTVWYAAREMRRSRNNSPAGRVNDQDLAEHTPLLSRV